MYFCIFLLLSHWRVRTAVLLQAVTAVTIITWQHLLVSEQSVLWKHWNRLFHTPHIRSTIPLVWKLCCVFAAQLLWDVIMAWINSEQIREVYVQISQFTNVTADIVNDSAHCCFTDNTHSFTMKGSRRQESPGENWVQVRHGGTSRLKHSRFLQDIFMYIRKCSLKVISSNWFNGLLPSTSAANHRLHLDIPNASCSQTICALSHKQYEAEVKPASVQH